MTAKNRPVELNQEGLDKVYALKEIQGSFYQLTDTDIEEGIDIDHESEIYYGNNPLGRPLNMSGLLYMLGDWSSKEKLLHAIISIERQLKHYLIKDKTIDKEDINQAFYNEFLALEQFSDFILTV